MAVLCVPLLGEWVGWRRWTAIVVGFLGVLLVARPGLGGLHPAALLSFGSAVCYAFYVISTRVLARSDFSETTLFYPISSARSPCCRSFRSSGARRRTLWVVALMVLSARSGAVGIIS